MKIIDNCLEEEYFDSLVAAFCCADPQRGLPWWYGTYLPHNLNHENSSDPLQYFFTHLIYNHHVPQNAETYNLTIPLCKAIEDIKSLLRIRANLFPGTKILHEYDMHTDYPFSHTAAILSLNTCDGYTKLVDGTKIDSVANRMLFFDAGEDHCSTTTSNEKARFNIIVNYLL